MRFISPFILAAAVSVVFSLVAAIILSIENTIGAHTWSRVGDIDGAIALLIIGMFVFSLATLLSMRLEKVQVPTVGDHFRHSSLLYVIAFVVGYWLISTYDNLNGALQYGYTVAFFASAIFGILINGLTLACSKLRQR